MRHITQITWCWILAAAAVSNAGKFDTFTDCESCVAAGFGWSANKNKCGGFPRVPCESVVSKPPVLSSAAPSAAELLAQMQALTDSYAKQMADMQAQIQAQPASPNREPLPPSAPPEKNKRH